MNRKLLIFIAAMGAVVSLGIAAWAFFSEDKGEPVDSSAVISEEYSAQDNSEQAVQITMEYTENVSETKPADPVKEFTVDILLAPYGYNVTTDYILEIAEASKVHSSAESHFDSSDEIYYSASVINGVTKIALPQGKYEVCLYPEDQPDNFKRYSWDINKDTSDHDLQLIVTDKIEPDTAMIVLRWLDKPRDIDGCFVGEGDFVYYKQQNGNHAHLDIDYKKGNGIETITVTDMKGDFRYYVNNYSGEVPMGKNSHAIVEVFFEDTKAPLVFTIPENIKDIWEVFSMKDGKITEVNNEGKLEFPEIAE